MKHSRWLLLAFACLAFAQSQPPSPTAPKPTQTQKYETGGKKNISGTDNQEAHPAPFTLNKESSAKDAQDKDKNGDKRAYASSPDYRFFGASITDWLIASFTLFLALLAGLQWRAMHQQAEYMRDALMETKKSAEAAIKAAEVSEKALYITERATLMVSIDSNITTLTNHHIQSFIHVKNAGKTTGFVKQVVAATAIHHGEGHPPAPRIDKPGGDLPSQYSVPASDQKRIICTAEPPPGKMAEVLNSTVRLYVIGRIIYDDEFGKRHITAFSFTYDPRMNEGSGGFTLVDDPGYNYAD